MTDWREVKEAQEEDTSQEVAGEALSPQGIASMQGNTEAQESKDPPQPDDTDDLKTVHPRKNLETLPSPEVEPITIKDSDGKGEGTEGQEESAEGKIKPPPGWTPGGPERGW
jgi:hypothetical protein